MDLNELLDVMDRAAANLKRPEAVWRRAEPFIPEGPARGSSIEYDDLCRVWRDLLAGLPPVDGWTVTAELPDIDAVGQAFIDYLDIGEAPFVLMEANGEPARQLAEYRFRLDRARRRAGRERLQQLVGIVNTLLPGLLAEVAPDSTDTLDNAVTAEVKSAVTEIERLLGDTTRRGRWSDLHRHMRFGQGHDWHDIAEFDWPSVKIDIEAAGFSDLDPLPVPDVDLGQAASNHPAGGATVGLNWSALDGAAFERVLFDLLVAIPGYQNVQWLMHTNAPDRGRDLSAESVLQDGAGRVRTERVIVQAKHWQSKAVALSDVNSAVASVALWEPPRVHTLIVATSGRFTTDAVSWAENRNQAGTPPYIDLWPESQLEMVLARHPYLAAAHHLRD